jgi:hypothetical protein
MAHEGEDVGSSVVRSDGWAVSLVTRDTLLHRKGDPA